MNNHWLNPDFAGIQTPTAAFSGRDGTLVRHVDYLRKFIELQATSQCASVLVPFRVLAGCLDMRVVEDLLVTRHQLKFIQTGCCDQDPIRRV